MSGIAIESVQDMNFAAENGIGKENKINPEEKCVILEVQGISLPFNEKKETALERAKKLISGYISRNAIKKLSISKRSVDARRRGNIKFIYSVRAEIEEGAFNENVLSEHGVVRIRNEEFKINVGEEKLEERPIVVGFGPAGIFASLLLAEYGYRPLVIERGGSIAERVAKTGHFYKTGELDINTNIQFGAGGAGTFSDGKLTTRIGDSRCRYVLEKLYSLGAPEDILVNAKPHIGTDKLRHVVENAAVLLSELGGEILYNTKLEKIVTENGHATKVITSNGEFACGAVILAIGHSARDTYETLISENYNIISKPFSVGVRIEHLQNDIDRALYGKDAANPLLPHGEYALSQRYGERAVYTFCMCPGGEVVAAASENGMVCVNGMSGYLRDGKNANSAVAVSIENIGTPLEQIAFQRRLETEAFSAGGGNFRAPIQTLGDFMNGKVQNEAKRILPTYMGGRTDAVRYAELSGILGNDISSMLRDGIRLFGTRVKGFDCADAVLTGVETRTSAPLRILRGEVFTATGHDNIYPAGEGAGYAGGIMSASVDGLRCAGALIERYSPFC